MVANKPPNKTNRIRSVTIEGFRSLKDIQHLELPQLTVLIGANGAGKSTLIRFFEMLSWMAAAGFIVALMAQRVAGRVAGRGAARG